LKRTRLRLKGVSETSEIKQEIQDTVRDIVILRDGGCVFRDSPHAPACNGYRADGELVLQADHLITRANSATYADTRLIVCVCKGHHGWKNWHQKEYEALVRTLISPERVALWKRCEEDSWRPVRTGIYDWKLSLIALKRELDALQA
jgi:hypothetical protein